MPRLFDVPVRRSGALACIGYILCAVALTWPLPARLGSAFLGPVAGDLGVYVWNVWVFGHEAVEHGRLPFSTDHVFAYTSGADFALHNYTPLAGLAGMALVPQFGLVASFNLLLLLALVTSAWAVFALGRRAGLRPVFAWLAGAIFIATPIMTARSTAHTSLVAVAAVPWFLIALFDVLDRPRMSAALAVGAAVAVATYSDAYFGVYCVIAGGFVVAWRVLQVELPGRPVPDSRMTRWLDLAIVLSCTVVLVTWLVRPAAIDVGPFRLSVTHAYNPLLVTLLLALVRTWCTYRPAWRVDYPREHLVRLARLAALAVATTLVLLAPVLAGLAMRVVDGRMPETAIFWRSSPRGVDLLSYFVPNPAHPWIGSLTGTWLMPPVEDAFPEFVAAFPLAGWLLIALAWRTGALPRMWLAFSACFMALSLGPFVHVGGFNSEVIGPWALLRYVPVVGLARSPARFAIVASLGLCLVAGFALQLLWAGDQRRRRLAFVCLLLLTAETIPGARPLFSPDVPDVYRLVAARSEEHGALLDLPTGIRDGASSVGDFRAQSQYFQAVHRRPLVGGYLSRVSEWRKRESRRAPVLRALFALSEPGGSITPALREEARASRDRFLARSCVRFVVIDKHRASPELRAFAVDVLDLLPLHDDGERELLVPVDPPACEPRRSRAGWFRRKRAAADAPAVLPAIERRHQ